jgi:hypothetical protein
MAGIQHLSHMNETYPFLAVKVVNETCENAKDKAHDGEGAIEGRAVRNQKFKSPSNIPSGLERVKNSFGEEKDVPVVRPYYETRVGNDAMEHARESILVGVSRRSNKEVLQVIICSSKAKEGVGGLNGKV